jgi:hypothetical protein
MCASAHNEAAFVDFCCMPLPSIQAIAVDNNYNCEQADLGGQEYVSVLGYTK